MALLHSPSTDHPRRQPRGCSRCFRRSCTGPTSAHSRRRGRANQDSILNHSSFVWNIQMVICLAFTWVLYTVAFQCFQEEKLWDVVDKWWLICEKINGNWMGFHLTIKHILYNVYTGFSFLGLICIKHMVISVTNDGWLISFLADWGVWQNHEFATYPISNLSTNHWTTVISWYHHPRENNRNKQPVDTTSKNVIDSDKVCEEKQRLYLVMG